MKKTVYSIAATAIVAFAAVTLASTQQDQTSSRLIANIEALSQTEVPTIPCYDYTGATCTFPAKDAEGNSITLKVYDAIKRD